MNMHTSGGFAPAKHELRDMGSTIMTLPSLKTRRRSIERATPQEQPFSAPDGIKENQFKIRLANAGGIRQEASMLVQERYLERGYGKQELGEDPNRVTVVAYESGAPVGTLSIGFDSPAGLLCDDLYRNEIDALRMSGAKVCEFIKFATSTSSSATKTMAALFHVVFLYAYRIHGCDKVVIEVNPHHVKFYRRALGFKPLGPERINRRVNAPAVLLQMRLDYIAAQIEKFGGRSDLRKEEKSLYPYFFSPEEERGILRRLMRMHEGRQ